MTLLRFLTTQLYKMHCTLQRWFRESLANGLIHFVRLRRASLLKTMRKWNRPLELAKRKVGWCALSLPLIWSTGSLPQISESNRSCALSLAAKVNTNIQLAIQELLPVPRVPQVLDVRQWPQLGESSVEAARKALGERWGPPLLPTRFEHSTLCDWRLDSQLRAWRTN